MLRALLLVAFLLPAAVLAQADVALVDLVSGQVSYSGGKVTPYMKVREGDRFTVPRGAQVRLLYFQGARQEHFAGPASFTAGKESSAQQSGSKPRVTPVPSVVPRRISRIPELVDNAKLGGVQLRGRPPEKPEDDALREARALYERMRREMPQDDITPELFLYATLIDYNRFAEMRPLADEMVRKQPASEEAKALAAWVRSRSGGVK
jgi:hypothetical protein